MLQPVNCATVDHLVTKERTAILFGFILPILFFIITWNLPPSPFRTQAVSISTPIMRALGLYQNWQMFAADNRTTTHTYFIRIKHVYADRTNWLDPNYDFQFPGYLRTIKRGVALNALVQWNSSAWRNSMLSYFCKTPGPKHPKWVVLEMARIPIVRFPESVNANLPEPSSLVPGPYSEDTIFQCF